MDFDLDNIVVIGTKTGGADPGVHSLLSIALLMARSPPAVFAAGGDRLHYHVVEPVLSVTPEAMRTNQIDIRNMPSSSWTPAGVCWGIETFLGVRYPGEQPIVLCSQHVAADMGFLKRLYRVAQKPYPPQLINFRTIDVHTLVWALGCAGRMPVCTLPEEALQHFNIAVPPEEQHTALGDALATRSLLWRLLDLI